jgi:hypothetical protein
VKVCSIDGCGRKLVARSWCELHWRRWKKNGDPNVRKNKAWDGRCTDCGAPDPTPSSRRCKPCQRDRGRLAVALEIDSTKRRAAASRYARNAYARRRSEALKAYGSVCACCGESEPVFLAVDHVNGGGNAHRRSMSSKGRVVGASNFYVWLERNGFPQGFQLLCHNCNFAKSHGGCPHARKEARRAG